MQLLLDVWKNLSKEILLYSICRVKLILSYLFSEVFMYKKCTLVMFLFLYSLKVMAYEASHNLSLGSSRVKVFIYAKDGDNSLTYFHPHQDEVTSEQVAMKIIDEYGGRIVSLQHSDPPQRNIDFTLGGRNYSLDPNRMFTVSGIKENLDTEDNDVISIVKNFADQVAQIVLYSLGNNDLIVAVHNNYNLDYSIKNYKEMGSLAKDAGEVYINPDAGTGEFFYVTDKSIFDIIKRNKYNVVLQNNKSVIDDGSFSVYSQKKGFRYINIEAERGNCKEQFNMLKLLMTEGLTSKDYR